VDRTDVTLSERVEEVRERIVAAGGDPDRLTVCAVTKGHDVDRAEEALAAGLVDLGENYAQELVAKADTLAGRPGPAARWHFIGRLQRNKVKLLAPHVALWQSIDRPELGPVVARHAPGASVLVQVATTGEEGKGGCAPEAVPQLVDALRHDGLEVQGLMTVGPTDAAADPRPGFAAVRALADRLDLAEVSMGMSADLEAAVAAGATIVRPGTALFGPRRARDRSGQ
jgi:PLP dependent protein